MTIYKAEYDFRCPQKCPDEDGSHQYILYGFFEINSDQTKIRCDGDYAYEIIGHKNQFGAFGGTDNNSGVRAGWAQISKNFYIGRWIEDQIEYLFSIKIIKEIQS